MRGVARWRGLCRTRGIQKKPVKRYTVDGKPMTPVDLQRLHMDAPFAEPKGTHAIVA
jgi:hypothetical protein